MMRLAVLCGAVASCLASNQVSLPSNAHIVHELRSRQMCVITTRYIVHLPPVRNVHRADGVAVVSLTAHVDVYLLITDIDVLPPPGFVSRQGCDITLDAVFSTVPCIRGESYDCSTHGTMWTARGCAGLFNCNGLDQTACDSK